MPVSGSDNTNACSGTLYDSGGPDDYYQNDSGHHPLERADFQCAFTAEQIQRFQPEKIMDIGSHRHFVLGLLAFHDITTLDIRPRPRFLSNENVINCNINKYSFNPGKFDMVFSLFALQHIGLSRYGDVGRNDKTCYLFGDFLKEIWLKYD